MQPEEVAEFQHRHLRTRGYLSRWPRVLAGAPPSRDERRYAETYASLLHDTADRTGANVLVDSSKYPFDAYLLTHTSGIELSVVHLVRDPRAVAHSWATPKPLWPGDDAPRLKSFRPAASSAIWTVWNSMAALLRRHVPVRSLRYEDLVEAPEAHLAAIAGAVGLDPRAAATAATGPQHQVAGNPARFAGLDTPIRRDDRWRTEMPRRRRLEASLPALPLLHRYGYSLRG